MASALAAATWMIWNNNAQQKLLENEEYDLYEGISHLKLQKLLYYAQGIHLALTNEKLFPEKIMAWKHGPVVAELYQQFKEFGKDPVVIEVTKENAEKIKSLDSVEENSLILAYDNFAIYTAWQLRNMTHKKNSPWEITVNKKGLNSEIDPSLIKNYFLQNIIEVEDG